MTKTKRMMHQTKTTLELPHGTLNLPIYLPDATLGVVRAVDATDLIASKIQALVMNTFHLMQRPGSSTIQALGGLHTMSNWTGPIITDSGGFQAYSLISENPKYGRLTNSGITFQPEGALRPYQLTPEKTVQLQLSYGADIVICLDDCTHVDAPFEVQEIAVRRTIDWARRCKKTFEQLVAQKKLIGSKRPLLFAVIQGGGSFELRRRCAEALLEIGFDGYGYGGWPLDSQGQLLTDIFAYTREIIPAEFPMHALGVGHPLNILKCFQMGYSIFDSAMPTRDARHARLYVLNDRLDGITHSTSASGDWLSYLYVGDNKHIKTRTPVDENCDCLCCRQYSVGYLHHLFKISDTLFFRLATVHNLRTMTRLTTALQRTLP